MILLKMYDGSHLFTQFKKEKLTRLPTLPIKLINMVFILEVVEMGLLLKKCKEQKVLLMKGNWQKLKYSALILWDES